MEDLKRNNPCFYVDEFPERFVSLKRRSYIGSLTNFRKEYLPMKSHTKKNKK